MMQSLLQAKAAVIQYMSKFGSNYKGLKLLDSAWETMSKYCEVLEYYSEEKDQTWMAIEEKLPVAVATDAHTVLPPVIHIEDVSDTVFESVLIKIND